MTTRTESRFGEVANLGVTYTLVGAAVPASTVWNVLLNVCNRTSAASLLRAFVADASWTTGEPIGGALKAAVAYDLYVAAYDVIQVAGFVMLAGEKLVVRASVATSLDILANGVAIT